MSELPKQCRQVSTLIRTVRVARFFFFLGGYKIARDLAVADVGPKDAWGVCSVGGAVTSPLKTWERDGTPTQ